MSIISPIIKTTFTNRIKELQSQPTDAVATNKATARVVNNQMSQGTVRGFTIIQDEPESVAGTGKGPTPTDFLILSVAFCENVVFARNAALNDLDLKGLETTASGTWNMKGLFEIGPEDPSFREIVVETHVQTDGPVKKVVEVANMTHRRCPVHATLRKATRLTFKLYVNDKETPL